MKKTHLIEFSRLHQILASLTLLPENFETPSTLASSRLPYPKLNLPSAACFPTATTCGTGAGFGSGLETPDLRPTLSRYSSPLGNVDKIYIARCRLRDIYIRKLRLRIILPLFMSLTANLDESKNKIRNPGTTTG